MLAVFVLTSLAPAAHATLKCGAVCDETWSAAGNPYVVTCDVTVVDGCELVIQAGAEVRFQTGTALVVDGGLGVNGVDGAEVTFISDSIPAFPGDWRGLILGGSSHKGIYSADISHAENGVEVHESAGVTLADVSLLHNVDGLYVHGDGLPTVVVSGSKFINNDRYGVNIRPDVVDPTVPPVTITNSEIHSNYQEYYDLWAQHTASNDGVVLTRGNWWGTDNPAEIDSRIKDRATSGSGSLAVDYCGYLLGPPGDGVSARDDVICPDLLVSDGESAVWNRTDMPYLVTSRFVLQAAAAPMLIGAGVEIRVVNDVANNGFSIWGSLSVNGTPGSPAMFTSDLPASEERWGTFYIPGAASITNALIEHADVAISVGRDALVSLIDVTARFNGRGMLVTERGWPDGPLSVTATGCTFTENDIGVLVWVWYSAPMSVSINNSSIHSNVERNFDAWWNGSPPPNPDIRVIDARDNWWGTADPILIGSQIDDHRSNATLPLVDWCGYLDGPPPGGTAVVDAECPDLWLCPTGPDPVVWDVTTRPYLLTSDLWVCPTATLQIEPGVEVRTVLRWTSTARRPRR
jgi:hypothetical protein